MRLYILCTLTALCFNYNLFAGCSAPRMWSDLGINYIGYRGEGLSALIQKDSFSLYLQGNLSCYHRLSNIKITRDGATIYENQGSQFTHKIKLPGHTGHYQIFFRNDYTFLSGRWDFDLTPTVFIQVEEEQTMESLAVPPEEEEHLPGLLLYPNPCKNTLTINNDVEKIKKIFIYSSNGEILHVVENDTKQVQIPVEDYPTGFYIIRVESFSGKMETRKIVMMK